MAGARTAVLHQRNFLFYTSSRLLSTTAMMMQSVAVGWQIYAKTGSVTDLGYVGLAQFLPFVLLILWAGQMADRHDRRRIVMGCNSTYLLGSLGLLAYTLSDLPSVFPVFAVLALLGASRAFAMPAGQAILKDIVPDEDFPQAVAFNSTVFHAAVVAGPVLGGLLYLAGPAVVHATVSSCLALSILLLAFVRNRRIARPSQPAHFSDVLEGLRFVRSRPIVLGAISLDLFAVLFGGATALLPAEAHDVLHAGSWALGILRACPAVGATLATLLLARFPLRHHVGHWMFAGVGLFGVATIVFGLSHVLWLSILALVFLGMGDMVSVYVRQILVQGETPDAVRGRVSAVSSMFIGASNELGEFESGMTAGWFGLVPSIVVGGCATLAVIATWSRLFPVFRKLDGFPGREPAPKA